MLDEKFWSQYLKAYDVLNIAIPYQELINSVCNKLNIHKGEVILDAGSGTGNLSLEIKKRGAKVIGLDNSMAAISLHKTKDPDPGVDIRLSDLTEQLPFSDCFFDKIVCILTLHTINPNKRLGVIKEFYRVLKPDGFVVLASPSTTFSPLRIYLEHIRKDIKKSGFIKVLRDMFILIIPTFKMFYYNFKIEKESKKGAYKMLELDEQYQLLEEAGFINLSETNNIYAKSAILNSGFKPK